MIIDKILDRKDGIEYKPAKFYKDISEYGEISNGIASAMDEGSEEDVKNELVKYITENDYNPEIIEFINDNKWI